MEFELNFYLIIPLVEILFCVGLLVLLMVKGQHHMARRPFCFFLAFMALWGIFIYLMRETGSIERALFWERFVFGSISSAALFFYLFSSAFTGKRDRKLVIYSLYGIYLIVLCLVPTNLIVKGMQLMWYGKAPQIGLLFPLYVLSVYIPLVLGLLALIRHRKATRINDDRVRDQYVIVGLIIMFIGGTTDYLPALGISMYPLGIVGNIIFCALASIAMLKYKLLEVRLVVRKGTAYSMVSMLLLGLIASFVYAITNIFRELFDPAAPWIITIVTFFVTAAAFHPVLSRTQRVVDRWFFRERYDHIQALKRFTAEPKGCLDLRQLSSSLVATIANAMSCRGAFILLPTAETGYFEVYAHSATRSMGHFSFSPGNPLTVTMKTHDGMIDIGDIDIIPSLYGLSESDRRLLVDNGIEVLLGLNTGERLIGIILIGGKTSGDPYSDEDKHLLKKVADSLAASIENASRYDSLRRELGELQKTMDGIIHAVSQVIGTRDPYTAGHQQRVAELGRAIAKEMGLSEWQVSGIYITGLLHDVGKVAVPTEILSKSGKLSQYEFSLIKDHPRIGYEILEKIEFPWPVTRAIIQHHERINGTGYPEGISGSQIILEARVIAVADVVEAISSYRPYRPALGLAQAIEEITRHKSSLYDPQVVDACLGLLNKKGVNFEQLMDAGGHGYDFRKLEEAKR